MAAAEDPEEVLRRARRAVAKATHPDLGGDPETHRKAMEALEEAADAPRIDPGAAVRKRWRALKSVKGAFREGRDTDRPL